MASEKRFDLKKFFFSLWPASGEWWGKFGHLCIQLMWIWVIVTFIVLPVRDRFLKKPAPAAQVETIQSNNGTITKTDSHDQKESKSWSLINLFHF